MHRIFVCEQNCASMAFGVGERRAGRLLSFRVSEREPNCGKLSSVQIKV
jgi:hypothetical protein